MPWLVYKIYPPELKSRPDVPVWAAGELKKMGRITVKEISMALLALLALGLWILGGDSINATTVALLVLSLMIVVGSWSGMTCWDTSMPGTCWCGLPRW